MSTQPKRYSAEVKAKVALEAMKGQKTGNEIASDYGVHPTQIAQWNKQVLEELPQIFSRRRHKAEQAEKELKAALDQAIGQLKVEWDWLQKKHEGCIEAKRSMIETGHPQLSIERHCEWLGWARSSSYYEPVEEREEHLLLMRLWDEQ